MPSYRKENRFVGQRIYKKNAHSGHRTGSQVSCLYKGSGPKSRFRIASELPTINNGLRRSLKLYLLGFSHPIPYARENAHRRLGRRTSLRFKLWFGQRLNLAALAMPILYICVPIPSSCSARRRNGLRLAFNFRIARDPRQIRACGRVQVSLAALPRWQRCRSSSSSSSPLRHALPHRHQPQAHQFTEKKSLQKWAWVLIFRHRSSLLYPMYPVLQFLLFGKMLRKVQIGEGRKWSGERI
jgi:hypothetical protein